LCAESQYCQFLLSHNFTLYELSITFQAEEDYIYSEPTELLIYKRNLNKLTLDEFHSKSEKEPSQEPSQESKALARIQSSKSQEPSKESKALTRIQSSKSQEPSQESKALTRI
jgi:hypothetical protein